MRVDELVERHYDELNENDLYIWQYIFHHKRDIQKTTINELARICNVSHTSILRFIRKIGLEGYQELKFYLKMEVEELSHFDTGIIDVLSNDTKRMLDQMRYANLDEVCEMIYQSENIYVYGSGDAQKLVAREFKRSFAYVQKISNFVSGHTEALVISETAGPQDLFIMISFSGENKNQNNVAEILKLKGAKLIGIGIEGNPTLSKLADIYLPFECHRFHTGYHELYYGYPLNFYVIVVFLFMRYLEYISTRQKDE